MSVHVLFEAGTPAADRCGFWEEFLQPHFSKASPSSQSASYSANSCTFTRQVSLETAEGLSRSFLKDKLSAVEQEGEGGRETPHEIVVGSVGWRCNSK